MNTRVLLTILVAAALIPAGHGSSAQRTERRLVDYAERERTAPTEIKTRLASLRAEAQSRNLGFRVAYTSALDRTLGQLTGSKAPANLARRARLQTQLASSLRAIDDQARASYLSKQRINPQAFALPLTYSPPSPSASSFDWRALGKVTPVSDQGQCGSCWAFAAIGAYEGSYLLRNGTSVDASEQDILDCSGGGNCKDGGWHTQAFDYMMSTGDATDASYPYTGAKGNCSASGSAPFHVVNWAYVTDQAIGHNPEGPDSSNQRMATIAEIKQALCSDGPLVVTVFVTGQFQAYGGGVFNEHKSAGEFYVDPESGKPFPVDKDGRLYAFDPNGQKYYRQNHAVTLIGWDDTKGAWLIKNSWGTGWGETCGYGNEKGYGWIAYGTNNIGYAATWVSAHNGYHPLPPIYYTTIREFVKLHPEEYKLIQTVRPLPDPMTIPVWRPTSNPVR
jgi:cathepsin L